LKLISKSEHKTKQIKMTQKIKSEPENEILINKIELHPIIDWMLYRLPDLEFVARQYHDEGKFIPEPGGGSRAYESNIEYQIINISQCEQIINIVEFEVSSLQEMPLLIYNLTYQKKKSLRDTAKLINDTVYQVNKIKDEIKDIICEGLNNEGIVSTNIYWFYKKLSQVV
jgi:hypothetical protein